MNGFENSRAMNGIGFADPNYREVGNVSRNDDKEVSQTQKLKSKSEEEEREDIEMG
jgi:hypothetical protein